MNKSKLNYSLTNVDINNFLGPNHIIRYRDLTRYSTIDQVFGDSNFVIVLIESKLNSGHWVCLITHTDGTIEQFDSYNGTIDHELNFISKETRGKLGEMNNLLTNLLKNRKTVYNKYQFQKLDPDVDTCGKWVICRLIMFIEEGMNISQFTKWYKGLMKTTGLESDNLVCMLIQP